MRRLVYTLFEKPKPTNKIIYQVISPIISKVWKKEIIDDYILPVFGKNSTKYKEEIKSLRKWKKMYKNGKRVDKTSEMQNEDKKYDKYKPDNIYKGELDIIIDEKCGSATLGLLSLARIIFKLKIMIRI